jgi:hypothetical protein
VSVDTKIPADERVAIAYEMTEHYNRQDVDAYVARMTDDACEALYRGAVLREGREGIRAGLQTIFDKYPHNRAEILGTTSVGDTVLLYETVTREPGGESFETVSIYSFEGDRVSRVEFVR